jgi:RND superfamily putative drug exporter
MTRLARWCFEHRWTVVVAWVVVLIALLGISRVAGSDFNSDLSLSNTDSQAAVDLLKQNFPSVAGEGDQVVFQATGGATIASPQVRSAVTAALAEVAAVPGVDSVASPYGPAGAAQVSRNGTVAFARVTWAHEPAAVTATDTSNLIAAAESADSSDLRVSLSGQAITNSERAKPGLSVAVGVIAALIVLLIVFGGAVLPALLPLAATALALGVGFTVVSLLTHALGIASASTDLAVLIGLGVGVDYGLFIVSRHRGAVKAGASYRDAAMESVNTSGRTVLFAGLTVCIALLGQFALCVGFLYGVSTTAAITVGMTIVASLTFVPAMLGFLGPKVLSRRERARLAAARSAQAQPDTRPSVLSQRWARFVEGHAVLAALGAVVMVIVIALPLTNLRLGSSDASTNPTSWTSRQSYDALAHGFGPGFNAPLELAGAIRSPGDTAAFDRLLAATANTRGVASVTRAVPSPDSRAVIATVYPTTGPQDQQTSDLVKNLRNTVIPQAEQGTGLTVHVGGETATNIDFAGVLGAKLPLFVIVVVILAFILLTAVFRSLLIPLVASVLNLLSVAAALGAISAVFTKGIGASLIGLAGTGPVDGFLPVIMFAVLFGLSMDYEVYTVSRMHEEWRRRTDEHQGPLTKARAALLNHQAVNAGQSASTRIVVAAAGIMILVFGSFLLGGHHLLQEFGFGLGFSVLLDALVIRSLLLPALMHLIGPANWALPTWLDRVLPRLDIENTGKTPAIDPGEEMSPATIGQ